MNRFGIAILILLSLIFVSSKVVAQCIADAGNDTTFCSDGVQISLGGNPTASGGSGNYFYTWSAISSGPDPYFTHASSFLSDTTAANPIIINVPDGERRTVNFKLFVVDDEGNECSDSVNVTTVAFICPLGQCFIEINAGDTVYLGPIDCLCANDSLITFHWTGNNLSDTLVENPFATPSEYLNYYTCMATDNVGCSLSTNCTVLVHPVGIDETQNNLIISSVYADPIDENSILQFENSNSRNLEIEIFNFIGRKIFETTSSGNVVRIKNLIQESGEYFYRISFEEKTISSGTFIKN